MSESARVVTCKHCKQKKRHKARGLCNPCYCMIRKGKVPGATIESFKKKPRPTQPPVTCKFCKQKRKHRARGLCNRCYIRIQNGWEPGITLDDFSTVENCVCKHCHQYRDHSARGLCNRCYENIRNGHYPNLTLDDFPIKVAFDWENEEKPDSCCLRFGCHNPKGSNAFGLCDKHITLITRKETA